MLGTVFKSKANKNIVHARGNVFFNRRILVGKENTKRSKSKVSAIKVSLKLIPIKIKFFLN
jgi:hypothetical protein